MTPSPHPDSELLARFARTQDERAFETLVDRHLGLVLGSARRRLMGREELAQEVAQNVFVILARKASKLRTHPCLAAWLQKTTTFESLRASRKESNHAKKMRHLQEEVSGSANGLHGNGDASMTAVLPILDEVLASLGEGDRQALVMRFYEGMSFRAIADRAGKTEAACQKQARRAVDKLADLLRRRGVAVPAAILTTGLTQELAKTSASAAISPGLATTITQSALSHLAGGATATQATFAIMNTKTALAAGAALIIACAGGGFVAGVVTKPDASSEDTNSRSAKNGNMALQPSGTNPSPRGSGNSGMPSDATSVKTLSQLLQLASQEMKMAQYDHAAGIRAKARLARIPTAQIPAALELIAAMPGGLDGESDLTDALLAQWARKEGAKACDFCLEKRTPLTMGIPPIQFPLTAWAETDPQAALDWYLEKAAQDHPSLKESPTGQRGSIANIRWVMRAWIHKDMEGAVAAFQKLENKKHRAGAIIAFSEHAGHLPERIKLLDMYAGLSDKNQRRDAIRDALDRWSRHRPEELAQWLDQNPVDDMQPTPLLRDWLLSDSNAATEWWMNRNNDSRQSRRLEGLVDTWAGVHLTEAGEWLAQQELTPDHDRAIAAYSRKAMNKDPNAALTWATRITGAAQRLSSLKHLTRSWVRTDAEAARSRIESAEISDDERSRLIELIDASANTSTTERTIR